MDSMLYRQYMCDDEDSIFSAIKEKMPWLQGQHFIVQQDNAPAHVGKGNMAFFDTQRHVDGWDIEVVNQPAQSPDMNINDIGFFRSLKCQVEELKANAKSLDLLYSKIQEAWDSYSSDTLERIWAHQFACYREILRDNGGNFYEATKCRPGCG